MCQEGVEDSEIIVVDNASTDGTTEMIKNDFPDVRLIENPENLGFAAGNNKAIESAKGKYILLLNPDTIVQPGSLDILIDFMENNNDVGACGPKLLNEDRSLQPSARKFPTFRGALYRHTIFRPLGIFKSHYRKWLMKDFKYEAVTDVDQLMGSALLLRASVLQQTGAMDERFFMYYEEVDLCFRIKQEGYRIVFVPQAEIIHLGGRSSGQVPVGKRIMMLRSLLKFFRKHRGNFNTTIFSFLFKPGIILKDVLDMLGGVVIYCVATVSFNSIRRKKSSAKIKNSFVLLTRYSLTVLFRM